MSKQCFTLWEEEVSPILTKIKKEINVDPVLSNTIEEVIQKVNSDIVYNINFCNRIKPLMSILSDTSYRKFISNLLNKEEFDNINLLSESLNKIYKIASYEFSESDTELEKEKNEAKKERIQNPTLNLEDIYSASKNTKKQILF